MKALFGVSSFVNAKSNYPSRHIILREPTLRFYVIQTQNYFVTARYDARNQNRYGNDLLVSEAFPVTNIYSDSNSF